MQVTPIKDEGGSTTIDGVKANNNGPMTTAKVEQVGVGVVKSETGGGGAWEHFHGGEAGAGGTPQQHYYMSWSADRDPLKLGKPALPPPEQYAPVEKFVAEAVDSRHPNSNDGGGAGSTEVAKRSGQAYRAVIDLLRRRDDPIMLHRVLLALRTAGHGTVLGRVASHSAGHAHMLHLVFKLDPFAPPDGLVRTVREELVAEQKQRRRRRSRSKSPPPPSALAPPQEEDADLKAIDDDSRLKPFVDYDIADAHLNLMVALVSANSVFVAPAVSALWRMATLNLSDAPGGRITRVHAALCTMFRLCPKGQSEIFPAMASNFPFKTLPLPQQVWYAHQCLAVIRYMPDLERQVLELIIDRCLEIDVEIKIEDGGEVKIEVQEKEEDDAEIDQSDVFELEIEEADGAAGGQSTPKDSSAAAEKVDEMADKLDSLMMILFQHLTIASKAHHDVSSAGNIRKLFKKITPAFDSTILTTHRSKYVQFVVFLLCGLDHEVSSKGGGGSNDDEHSLYRDFAAKLIEILLDPFRATVMRQAAACYLASFVSRATYVCPETVCESVSALLRWAEAYMQTFPTDRSAAAAFKGRDSRNQCEVHSLFYTACQGAFYIMCFRGCEAIRYYRAAADYHSKQGDAHDLDEDIPYADMESIDIGPERWATLCCHHLNPLRYCLESVRGEFLHVADVLGLLGQKSLDSLFEESKKMSSGIKKKQRASLIQTPVTMAKRRLKGGVGGLGRGSNPLDSFFPFDPYLLRRSHVFVDPYYKHWEGSIYFDESSSLLKDEVNLGNVFENALHEGEEASSNGSAVTSDSEDSEGDEHMPESVGHQAMSLTSVGSGLEMITEERISNDDPVRKKEMQREAWSVELKRGRAHSIESGSW